MDNEWQGQGQGNCIKKTGNWIYSIFRLDVIWYISLYTCLGAYVPLIKLPSVNDGNVHEICLFQSVP